MPFPIIFAQLAAGVQPLADFDTMFNVVGSMAVIACTATGTNNVALTPSTNMPTVSAYSNYQAFGFVATATSTGAVTLNVSSVGALNAYASDGATQLTAGSLQSGGYYVFVYNAALNSSAGGFQIISGGASGALVVNSLNGGQLAGLRNRTINGDMRIDQRNAGVSQTITAAAGAAYTLDRFYATCTGANITGQQISTPTPDQYAYQFTGTASATAIAFGQRYEATNVYDLASTTATFSVKLSNSLLTTVTWTAYYPTSTDNWASRTQIVTGTFTVTSTLSKYSVNIALGANITAGLEIELSVGAQISGTWVITEWQLENGTLATPFERRPIGLELSLCQRYFYDPAQNGSSAAITMFSYSGGAGAASFQTAYYPVTMRVAPTITLRNQTYGNCSALTVGSNSPQTHGANATASGVGGISVGYNYKASAEL